MENPNKTTEQTQKALHATVNECVQSILNQSKNEEEANLQLEALKTVVSNFQKK